MAVVQASHMIVAANYAVDAALASQVDQTTLMPSSEVKRGVDRSESFVDLPAPDRRATVLARHHGGADQAGKTLQIGADARQKMAADESPVLVVTMNHQISPAVGRDMNNLITGLDRQTSSVRNERRRRIVISDEINEPGSFRMPSAKVLDHRVAGRGTRQGERHAGVENVTDEHVGVGPVLLKEAENQIGARSDRTEVQVGEKQGAVAADRCLLGGRVGQGALLQFLHLPDRQKIG